jgi:hypothetical protein
MQFASSPAEIVRSVNQRWLLKRWREIAASNPLPLWSALPSEEIESQLEELTFLDVVATATGLRFVIRYHGRRIAQAYGEGCRSRYLDEIMAPALRDRSLAAYDRAVRSRLPVYTVVETSDVNARPVSFERLILPFSDDGVAVSRIVASLEMVSVAGAFERHDLLRAPAVPPRYAQYSVVMV